MKTLRIGRFIFSSKAIGLIVLGFFCFGVLLGANIASVEATGKNISLPLILTFNIPIWLILYKSIKREITTTG